MADEDYWQNIGADAADGKGPSPVSAVEIKRFDEGLPVVQKIGQAVTPQEVLPDDFFSPDGAIFAVLDASCLESLPVLLEAEGLEHVSLFSGELASVAGDAAPYLVRLPQESDLLRALLTTSEDGKVKAGAFWAAQAGIFVQTSLSLSQLRTHLRRFMRVLDAHERAYFFRFWEPVCAEAYFAGLDTRASKAARWFHPHDMSEPLMAMWFPVHALDGANSLVRCTPNRELKHVTPERGGFRLDQADLEIFSHLQWRRDVGLIADRLRETPFEKDLPDRDQLLMLCDATMRRMIGYGFTHLDMLYLLCVWEVQYGPTFEQQKDAKSVLQIMRRMEKPAEWRFAQIKDEMIAREAE
ncbi:DUF4123 domain-containing protein [Tritonibacter mobilis]|uniref:DUF4123 domain-containing protein n=1 Tax=Tritonibacter mobilis TaxID=379347 RepID=UPI00398FEE9E